MTRKGPTVARGRAPITGPLVLADASHRIDSPPLRVRILP
jgi:hypothetical protein